MDAYLHCSSAVHDPTWTNPLLCRYGSHQECGRDLHAGENGLYTYIYMTTASLYVIDIVIISISMIMIIIV